MIAQVKLGDICQIDWGDTSVTKKSYTDKGFLAFSASGPDGFLPYHDFEREAVILSAIGARCGKTWWAEGKWSCIKNTITAWSKDENRLDNRYLYWVTANPEFWPKRGAAQPFITLKDSRATSIPLPPLEEQRRIAAILDTADVIRQKRQRSIALLDDFLRVTFLDMFGDPVTNPKGWEKQALSSLAEIRSGVAKGKKIQGEKVSVPYMRVANVQDGYLDLSEIKNLDISERDISKYQLAYGDILLTEGGDPDKLGRGAIWRDEIPLCIHQNHIFCVRAFDEAKPEYLAALINSFYGKLYFLRSSKQTTGIATINKTQLSNFPVLLPPCKLQEKFAENVSKVMATSASLTENLVNMETLFVSLSHRAFRGELTDGAAGQIIDDMKQAAAG